MRIFDIFRRSPVAETPAGPRAAVQSSGPGVLITNADELDRYLREGEANTAAGVNVTPTTSMRVAAVYGCVRIISGKVATLPLDIKRKVDERTRKDADDHPLSRIFKRKPNDWMRPAELRRMLTAHILLRGNAFARIVRGGLRDVQALLPLNPDRVTVKQLPSLRMEYHYRRPDGGDVVFGQDEVFHLRGMTLDGVTGVSVLKYAKEAVGLALATSRHGSKFFANGTQVGSKIEHPTHLGKEGLEFLHASLEKYRSGGAREQGTLILEEGAKFDKIGMTMEDAAFVDTMKLTRGDIGMFFGVPPHMLGDTEKNTSWGSGIEQQALGFVAYTLEDWLIAWEEAVNVDLVRENEPDIYARFNRNALVRGDIKTRWEAYAKGRRMKVLSSNDVRGSEDMNPIEGGDVYENPEITVPKEDEPDEAGSEDRDEPSQAA